MQQWIEIVSLLLLAPQKPHTVLINSNLFRIDYIILMGMNGFFREYFVVRVGEGSCGYTEEVLLYETF